LKVDGNDFLIEHDFVDHVDGPIPSRHEQLHPDFYLRARIREIDGGIAIDLREYGIAKLITQIEFIVRPEGTFQIDGRTVPLVDGEHHYLTGGPVRIINGADSLEIDGDLVVEHLVIRPGQFTNQPRRTNLLISPRTPYKGTIIIRGCDA